MVGGLQNTDWATLHRDGGTWKRRRTCSPQVVANFSLLSGRLEEG